MGMRPDGMARWGVVAIFKEAARILHHYRRPFLPFYLAFFLTGSLVANFQIVFLSPSAPSRSGRIDDHQGGRELVPTDTAANSIVVSLMLSVLVFVFGLFGVGAVTYIVADIYSKEESESDPEGGFIVKKVFKLLPHAFLRIWVTQLWTFLLMFVVYLFSLMVGGLLYAILSAATGLSNLPLFLLLALIPFVAGALFLVIMLRFSQFIAVLEPENYGREALKRSFKLVKAGGPGTVIAVLLITNIFSGILMFPSQTIATGRLPVWEEIVFGAFLVVVNSVFTVYVGVVSVVMYFVYASRLNAVISSIPEFITASPHNPYKPLVVISSIPECNTASHQNSYKPLVQPGNAIGGP